VAHVRCAHLFAKASERRQGVSHRASGSLLESVKSYAKPTAVVRTARVERLEGAQLYQVAAAWRKSGHGSAAKNVPKSSKVLPRDCGARLFITFGCIAATDKNDRFWRVPLCKRTTLCCHRYERERFCDSEAQAIDADWGFT